MVADFGQSDAFPGKVKALISSILVYPSPSESSSSIMCNEAGLSRPNPA